MEKPQKASLPLSDLTLSSSSHAKTKIGQPWKTGDYFLEASFDGELVESLGHLFSYSANLTARMFSFMSSLILILQLTHIALYVRDMENKA